MDVLDIARSLEMALLAVTWICAAGAFFDLVVMRPIQRFYSTSIEMAESRGRFFTAADMRMMLQFLQRVESAVSFITCWRLVRGLGAVMSRRRTGKTSR